MNNLTNFKATGVDNQVPVLRTVQGQSITVSSAKEEYFYSYYCNTSKKWYVNELTTGLAISFSEISESEAILKAEQTILKAKNKGVFYKKLNMYQSELQKNGINIPINKKIATA